MTEWYGTNATVPDGHVEGGLRAAVPSRGVSVWLLGTVASPRPFSREGALSCSGYLCC